MSFGSLIVIVLVGFILLSIISEQQVEAKSKEGNKGGVPTKKPKVPKGKKSTPKFKRKTTTRKRKKTTKKNRDKKSTLRWKRFTRPTRSWTRKQRGLVGRIKNFAKCFISKCTTNKQCQKMSSCRFCIPKIKRCGPKDKYFDVAQKNLKDVKIEKADKIKGVKCTSDKDCYPVVQECRMSSISKAKICMVVKKFYKAKSPYNEGVTFQKKLGKDFKGKKINCKKDKDCHNFQKKLEFFKHTQCNGKTCIVEMAGKNDKTILADVYTLD